MARLIAALAALVLGWLSILTPSSAAVTLTSSPVATYGYDDHHSPAQFVDTNSERGPPAAHDRATTVYDARALLLSPDSAAAGARSSPSRSGAASWGRSASVRGDVVAANTARAADDTIDLYRAVGVREYESVMSTGRFTPAANSLEGRQFALSLDEALAYADTDLSKVAILRATVSRSGVEGVADFSTRIDPFIFRSGVYTIQPGMQSDLFHAGLRGISHAF